MPHNSDQISSHTALPTIPTEILTEIYAHAKETYPEECCGFLIGPDKAPSIDEARQCENQQNRYHDLDPEHFPRTARQAYYLGGKDLLFLAESLNSPRPVKVIYHSHPDVGAYFSEEDTRAALGHTPDDTAQPQYPVGYIVIDAQASHIAGAKLFHWSPAQRSFIEIAAYHGNDY